MATEITHERLVKAAAAWLAPKHRIVATEFQAMGTGESPDAIGWSGWGRCTVVECKVTRADFRANHKKTHERAEIAVGDSRWFLTPPGLVSGDEVPTGWGLLEFTPSGHGRGYFIRKKIEAPVRQPGEGARSSERRMLIALAGRAMDAATLLRAIWLGEESGDDSAAPTSEEGDGPCG